MSEPGVGEFSEQQTTTEASNGFLSSLKTKTSEILTNPKTTSILSGITSVLSQAEIPNPAIQTALTAGLTAIEVLKNKTALTDAANDVIDSLHDPNKVAVVMGAADTVVNYALPNSTQVLAAGFLAELGLLHDSGFHFRSVLPHRNNEKVKR